MVVLRSLAEFQPTRPRGARQVLGILDRLDAQVSTHAPARGATKTGCACSACSLCFNPRAREGRDIASCMCSTFTSLFQPTRPRGARRHDRRGLRHDVRVSTHAPARGATGSQRRQRGHGQVSTHAPARGATLRARLYVYEQDVSTHAPARGATRHRRSAAQPGRVSTHAPARGATPCRGRGHRPSRVSTHAPARGATRRPSRT